MKTILFNRLLSGFILLEGIFHFLFLFKFLFLINSIINLVKIYVNILHTYLFLNPNNKLDIWVLI